MVADGRGKEGDHFLYTIRGLVKVEYFDDNS